MNVRYCRYERRNGHASDLTGRPVLTPKRHWPCAAAIVLMPFSAPAKVLAWADRMPFPELGGGNATARVHQGTRCNGSRLASWSGRPNSTQPVTCGDCVAHCTGSAARTHGITVGCAQYIQQCSKRL